MKKISLDLIKDVRRMTYAGVNDCKKALEEASGDIDQAVKLLRKRGLEISQAKKGRAAQQGRIQSYVHLGNQLGVLVEVNCETDFVARNEDFCEFSKNVAMQIAASCPCYITREDVPQQDLEAVEDKEDFYKRNCLMEQPFIKDTSVMVKDLLVDLIGKMGENILVQRFVRYKIGEE